MAQLLFKSLPQVIVLCCLLTNSRVAYASGGPLDPAPQFINIALVLAGLTYLYTKAIKPMLRTRAETIKNELEKGQKELSIAQAHYEEVEKEYQGLEQKVADIQSKAVEDISDMKVALLKQMEDEDKRIELSTKRSIQDELSRAKRELQEESVEIALTIAEELVKSNITDADQKRFKTTFIRAVEKEGTNV